MLYQHYSSVLLIILLVFQSCVGEQCTTYGAVRLVGGSGSHEGNVQVCVNNTWGYVCDNSWGSTNARVVCRQLKFSSSTNFVVALAGSFFGSGDGLVHLDNVQCPTSHYYKIINCPHGNVSCNPYKDIAGVICSVGGTCQDGAIRLTHGVTVNTTYGRSEGRVEMCYNNEWGTVCPNPQWNENNTEVICRQLGYNGSLLTFPNTTHYGDTATPIKFRDVQCVGNETSLFNCSKVVGSKGCLHSQDIGVRCFSNDVSNCTSGSVRLWSAYKNTPANEGMVQICRQGKWNAVCDKFYPGTCYIGRIVCQTLGFAGAYTLRTNAGLYYGYYDRNEYFEYSCYGSFTHLYQCPYNFNSYYCGTFRNSLGVICAKPHNVSLPNVIKEPECSDGDVRLVNGTSKSNGRTEYCYKGVWSPMCSLNSTTAGLVCNKLGFNKDRVSIVQEGYSIRSSTSFSHLNCSSSYNMSLSPLRSLSQCRIVTKLHSISNNDCYISDSTHCPSLRLNCYESSMKKN